MSAWPARPIRFFQHLLREVDAEGLDPASLVAEARRMGAGGMIVMGGGFSAWYPTALDTQRINPHMQGDFLGGVLAAVRAAGLRALVRMDISKSQPAQAEAHPDWFVRRPDGSLSTVWAMPQLCATGPFWEACNFAILDEILGRYEVDGFFYNYFHVPQCFCARCRALVLRDTGAEVPAPGERRPAYEAWRAATLAAYTSRVRDHIAARAPAARLVPYHHVRDGWDMRAMAQASGLISAQISNPVVPNPVDPQPIWNHWAAEEALLARALRLDAPALLVQTGSGFFASRQTAMPPARLVANVMQAAAHGADTCPAINGTLAQDDPRALPAIEALGTMLAANAGWYAGLESVARTALLHSPASRDWGPDGGNRRGEAWGHVAELRGCYEMLVAGRYPCDLLVADGIEAASLSQYAVIVLPACCRLSTADAATLDDYAAAGGTVIATADSDAASLCRALPPLTGAGEPVSGGYFTVADASLRQALGGAPFIGAEGTLWPVEAAGGDLRLIGPFENNAPEFATLDGPATLPGYAAKIYGQGTGLRLPWRIGALFHRHGVPDYQALFLALVARHAGLPPIESTARAVEFVLYRHKRGHVLHVLNQAAAQTRILSETVPLAGFDIGLHVPGTRALRLDTGAEMPVRRDGATAWLRLDQLDGFAAIAVLDEENDHADTP